MALVLPSFCRFLLEKLISPIPVMRRTWELLHFSVSKQWTGGSIPRPTPRTGLKTTNNGNYFPDTNKNTSPFFPILCPISSVSKLGVCSWWDRVREAHSTHRRWSHQAYPALFQRAEVPKGLGPKQGLVGPALPEEETLSEATERQQSQSSLRALLHVPAMSNNSRFVYRIETFRLISWEISLNTFSLLH